jgi:hypothetical protein
LLDRKDSDTDTDPDPGGPKTYECSSERLFPGKNKKTAAAAVVPTPVPIITTTKVNTYRNMSLT